MILYPIDEAIKLGDRIAIMNLGRLEQYDTPAAILAKPASDLVIDLLGPDRGPKRLSVTPIDIATLQQPHVVHGELDRERTDGDGHVADRARPLDARVSADRTLYDAFSQMLIHQAMLVAVVGDRFCGVLTPESFVAEIQRLPAEVEGVGARRT